MSEAHSKRVREAFTRQASAFEDTRLNRVFTLDAAWLFDSLECGANDLLLDVAAGTGHAARSLAHRVRAAVAIDVTPAMLAAGRGAAVEQGLDNVLFMLGDAVALPFLDASFDVVVTRFALHHVEEPARVIAEMARCVRPCGQLLVADMVADEDAVLAARQNRLERVRDASHARMLSSSELRLMVQEAGLRELSTEAREIDRPLEPWLEHAATPPATADELRAELENEIAGGEPTGLQPYERDGELRFVQRWAALLGRIPTRAER